MLTKHGDEIEVTGKILITRHDVSSTADHRRLDDQVIFRVSTRSYRSSRTNRPGAATQKREEHRGIVAVRVTSFDAWALEHLNEFREQVLRHHDLYAAIAESSRDSSGWSRWREDG
jgi:hypothetical protein